MSFFFEKPCEDNETCFICGQAAVSVEHIIPKWLQNRFNLWDEELLLPNRSSIKYRNLTVPACLKCNSKVYGILENKVSKGNATDSEIWKWVNKIHYGLNYKDRSLEWDRKNPGYKIGQVFYNDDPLELDRHFLHSVSGDFRTEPDPFGSVYKFTFSTPQEFAFAHMKFFSSLCVSLGNVGYVVFVKDGQALERDKAMKEIYKRLARKPCKDDMLFFFAQCLEQDMN